MLALMRLMARGCHSRMYLAGIQIPSSSWMPDKSIRA